MTIVTTCHTEGHADRPAIAAALHSGHGNRFPQLLCTECALCTDAACTMTSATLDPEARQTWCPLHNAAFTGGDDPAGVDIVPVSPDGRACLDDNATT